MKLPGPFSASAGGAESGILPRPSEPVQYVGLIIASALAAAVLTQVAYRTSPLIALALPGFVAIVALVFWRPMAGVYVAVLAIPLERIAVPAGAAAELTPAKGMLLLVAAAATVRWITSSSVAPARKVWLPFAGLLLVMALGIAYADESFVVAKITVQWAAFLVVAMLIASAGHEQLERIFMALAVAGGVLGAIAVATSGQQTLVAGGEAATGRAQAGFDHPALLAFFLVLAFPPAMALTLRGRYTALRPVWAVCAALCVAGIAFSLTRGAMLALALSLVVLLFLPAFRRWAAVVFVGLAVFAALNAQAIQNSPQLEVIGQRLSTITETQATASNQRPYIWSKTPAMIADHPVFGVGAGNFPFWAPRYAIVDYGGAPFVHAHNVVLTTAAENGIVGAALLMAFGFAVVTIGLRALLAGKRSPHYPFLVAAAASVAAAFFTGMTDDPPATIVIMGAILILIGCLAAAERLVREEPEPAAGQ
jgi:O-antigen ligase